MLIGAQFQFRSDRCLCLELDFIVTLTERDKRKTEREIQIMHCLQSMVIGKKIKLPTFGTYNLSGVNSISLYFIVV